MDCNKRLWDDPTGLKCARTDPHTDGHIFQSSSSSDRHNLTEAGQD